MYTYTISKTNEILFNLVVIAHYAHMYSVKMCFPL